MDFHFVAVVFIADYPISMGLIRISLPDIEPDVISHESGAFFFPHDGFPIHGGTIPTAVYSMNYGTDFRLKLTGRGFSADFD